MIFNLSKIFTEERDHQFVRKQYQPKEPKYKIPKENRKPKKIIKPQFNYTPQKITNPKSTTTEANLQQRINDDEDDDDEYTDSNSSTQKIIKPTFFITKNKKNLQQRKIHDEDEEYVDSNFNTQKITNPKSSVRESKSNLQQRITDDENDDEYDEREESKRESSQEEINENSNSNETENISELPEKRKSLPQNKEEEFYFDETPINNTKNHAVTDQNKKLIDKVTTTIKPSQGEEQYNYQIKHNPRKILKDTIPNQQTTYKHIKKPKKIHNNPILKPRIVENYYDDTEEETHTTKRPKKYRIKSKNHPKTGNKHLRTNKNKKLALKHNHNNHNNHDSHNHNNHNHNNRNPNNHNHNNHNQNNHNNNNQNDNNHNHDSPEQIEKIEEKESSSESLNEEKNSQQSTDYTEAEEQQIVNVNKTPVAENIENNFETTFVPLIDLKDFVPTESEIVDYNLQERYKIEDNIKQKLQKSDNEYIYNPYQSEENSDTREISSENKPKKYINNEKSSEELQIPTPRIQFEINSSPESSENRENHKKIREPTENRSAKPYYESEYIQNSNKKYKDPEKEYLEHTLPIKDKIRSKLNQNKDTYTPKSSQFNYDYIQKDSDGYVPPRNLPSKLNTGVKLKKTNQKPKLYKQNKQKPSIVENYYDDTEEEVHTTRRPKKYRIKLQKSTPKPIENDEDAQTLHSVNEQQKIRLKSNLNSLKNQQPKHLEDVEHAPSDNAPSEQHALVQSDTLTSEQKANVQADSQVSEQKHPHAHNGKHKKGGGKEHHSEHHGSKGEKAESNHKGKHEHHEKEVGHHDKEGHKGGYKDHGGHGKKSHSEDGYFGGHKAGAKGEKASEVNIIF